MNEITCVFRFVHIFQHSHFCFSLIIFIATHKISIFAFNFICSLQSYINLGVFWKFNLRLLERMAFHSLILANKYYSLRRAFFRYIAFCTNKFNIRFNSNIADLILFVHAPLFILHTKKPINVPEWKVFGFLYSSTVDMIEAWNVSFLDSAAAAAADFTHLTAVYSCQPSPFCCL